MTALEQLNAYLKRLQLRARLLAASRGAGIVAGSALLLTLVFVWIGNRFEFAEAVVLPLRILLFLALATAASFALFVPLLKVNRRWVTRMAERRIPGLEERLLTVTERPDPGNPFTELLAEDALRIAREHEREQLRTTGSFRGFLISAVAAAGALLWIIAAGPGYWGYGAALLWIGGAHAGTPPLYDISVEPGNKTVRRKSDQVITAQLIGFSTSDAMLHARYRGAAKWDQTPMQSRRSGNGYQFLFAGLSDSVDYYVEAGARQSKHYTLAVKDLPGVKRVRVTVHFPSRLALQDVVEDPGGDVRAVEGSQAEIRVLTDRPLEHGALVLDNGSKIELARGEGNWLGAGLRVEKDGSYHVAALDGSEAVRISDDYFIEAKKDEPPSVKIARPGRDPHVSPIEELPVTVEAADDFGIRGLDLHYSVNGGPEEVVPLLNKKEAKETKGGTTLYLEKFKLVPGDLVSLYATARDASKTSRSDIVFAQAEPFDYKFRQSQQMSSEGTMGGEENKISERQKEVIAATWNEMKDGPKQRSKAAEEARFLAELEGKLAQQAKALADRMRSRELVGTSSEFEGFSRSMDQASEEMNKAVGELKPDKWRDALPPEQKALQALLRAEATFRDIQIAFSRSGRGMGGNGAGRDLERLFDLELDTTKNQYETGESASSASAQQKAVDDALERLAMLAKRQQELGAQQNQQQAFEQRWQEEQLRREAEQLRQQMEQLAQNWAQAGRARAGSQQGQQTSGALRAATNALQRAEDEMRKGVSEGDSTAQQRATAHLREAQDALSAMQRQQTGKSINDLAQRAQEIANRQKEIANRLKQMYGGSSGTAERANSEPGATGAKNGMPEMDDPRFGLGYGRRYWQQFQMEPARPATPQEKSLAGQKENLARQLNELERQMQEQAQGVAGNQPDASAKLRSALSDAQQKELALRMKKGAEWIRDGYGSRTSGQEDSVTEGTEQLSRQLRDAQQALQAGVQGGQNRQSDTTARALSQLRALREQLERGNAQRQGQNGQNGGDGPIGGPGPAIGGDSYAGLPDAMRQLSGLRQQVGGRDRQLRDDIDGALWSLNRLYGARSGLLDSRISHEVLPSLERLEVELSRRLGNDGENARTAASESAPEKYRDAVAEYFNRLSR
jgi:hypothetical protein